MAGQGVFLTTTVVTSLSGFLLPAHHFMPSHAVGIISLLALGVAIYARYARDCRKIWGKIYVVSAVASLYLNVFVGIVQAFQKIPVLKAVAPTQSEPPFVITQGVVLLLFIAVGIISTRRFCGSWEASVSEHQQEKGIHKEIERSFLQNLKK